MRAIPGASESLLRPARTKLITDLQGVVSKDTELPLFNAMTAPLNSAQLRNVRAHIYLAGLGACKARPALQFSDDGINWTDAAKAVDEVFHSTEGWTYTSDFCNIFGLAGTTPRLYVRFGVQMLNTTADGPQGSLARLNLEFTPIPNATLPLFYQKVWSRGSSTAAVFVPFSDALPTDGISLLRPTVEFTSSTGDLQVTPAWQESNTPDDASSWGSVTTLGSPTSTEGIQFGTTFSSVSFTKKYFRIGVSASNVSGSENQAGRVALRIDMQ